MAHLQNDTAGRDFVQPALMRSDRHSSSSESNDYDEKPLPLQHMNTAGTMMDEEKWRRPLQHTDTASTQLTSFEGGVGNLYDDDGNIVLMPAPTKDPRDPLNMSTKRKWAALIALCFYGALAAAAELILGAMLPVFALQYAGIDPSFLNYIIEQSGGLPANVDALLYLSSLPGAAPILQIYLLASLPILTIGLSNLLLVPLAIATGRRPVILVCGVIAIGGACWAGASTSLPMHLVARVVQAIGAGTVESLIPFIIADIAHVHERNMYISTVFAAQGSIIIAVGISAPYMITNLSWRYVYYVTAAAAGFFLIGVFFLLPETRYSRTRLEMAGVPRPENPNRHYLPRTFKSDIAFITGGVDWRKGWVAFLDTLRTFFYPQIFFITMLNSAMISAALAAGYTVTPALLTKPWSWSFLVLGLCLIPVLIGAVCVGVITGALADKVANIAAKRTGQRVPENQLWNLVVPTLVALVGTVLYGTATGSLEKYPWIMALIGLGMMAFGFLGANTVGAVYVIECYPQLTGPALVNIASFRMLIAFVFSFYISDWVIELGYFRSMMIYTGLIGGFAMLLPVVMIWGPSWRRRWPGPKHLDTDMAM